MTVGQPFENLFPCSTSEGSSGFSSTPVAESLLLAAANVSSKKAPENYPMPCDLMGAPSAGNGISTSSVAEAAFGGMARKRVLTKKTVGLTSLTLTCFVQLHRW